MAKRSADEESVNGTKKAKVVVVNGSKYDGQCSWLALEQVAEVSRYADSSFKEMIERAEDADIVITKELPVTAELISKLGPGVRAICEAGTGFNNIDVAAAKEKGIVVCNVPAYSSEGVASLVMTYVLNFSCSMFDVHARLERGDRDSFTNGMRGGGGTVGFDLPHFDIAGKSLGVIGGNGRIGTAVVNLGLAFGMKVFVSGRTERPKRDGVEFVTLDELLQTCDFVSINCPLLPETRHLINASKLRMMRKSAFIINTGRGPVIKQDDLIAALNDGVIAGAGLDVTELEPLPKDSPVFTTKNLYLTPHIGWQRLEARQRLVDTTAANVAAVLQGKPINVVS